MGGLVVGTNAGPLVGAVVGDIVGKETIKERSIIDEAVQSFSRHTMTVSKPIMMMMTHDARPLLLEPKIMTHDDEATTTTTARPLLLGQMMIDDDT